MDIQAHPEYTQLKEVIIIIIIIFWIIKISQNRYCTVC